MVHPLTDGKLLTETCTFKLGGLRQSSARRLQLTAFSDVLACSARYPRRADSTPVPFYTLIRAKSIAKLLKSRENDQQTEKINIAGMTIGILRLHPVDLGIHHLAETPSPLHLCSPAPLLPCSPAPLRLCVRTNRPELTLCHQPSRTLQQFPF